MQTTTLALVGGAHIHTPGFIEKIKARPDLKVKYVWDPDPTRADRRATALMARTTPALDTIWRDREVSAAVICSETRLHESLVVPAAAAGKHLFVEKPLGMGAADSARMALAIEKAGILFQTGYFMRGDPLHLFLKQQVEAGSFGTITRYRQSNCHKGALAGWFDTEWRWMTDPAQAGCGAFGDLGTHALDIMLWIMGEVSSVTASVDTATRRYGDVDEYGEGLLRFRRGGIGTLAASWVDVAHPASLILSGTEGHACILNGKLHVQSSRIPGADGKAPWTDLPAAWPHAFDLFLDAIAGKPHAPLVTVREAALRSTVMEALYTAAREHRWIDLPNP